MQNFIKIIETTMKERWDSTAIEEFTTGKTQTYGELASNVVALGNLFSAAGLERGDKVAIHSKSCMNWIDTFLGSVCNGFVSVQLFNGFTAADTQALVNHSESKILYTEAKAFEAMDFEAMPALYAAIDTESGRLLASRNGFDAVYGQYTGNAGVSASELCFSGLEMEELCSIMYTSGSTGNPKGVMLSVKNFSANIEVIPVKLPFIPGTSHVSMLPYAHIFGLTGDVLTPLCRGMHLHILGLPPIPKFVMQITQKTNPHFLIAVPLVVIKLVEAILGEELASEEGKRKLADYQNHPDYCEELKERFMGSLGSNLECFLTGGAAFPAEMESLLVEKLKAPFIQGYGMTECAPIISHSDPGRHIVRSCGQHVPNIEVRIDSPDPETIPGEVTVHGDLVFSGYYKNLEATAAVFTEDGWFRTGDVGTLVDRNIFLVGRCKSMLLSENGQNIFPEEIEQVLNTLPYVQESIIVQRGARLVALVVVNPDALQAANLDADSVNAIMKANITKLNTQIPKYSEVHDFEIRYEPFAKTPKGSIRRFMYR